MKRILAISLALFSFAIGFGDPPRHIKVYFFDMNMASTQQNPLQLKAVDRTVAGEADPYVEAMEVLLAGPSSTEQSHGLRDLETDGVSFWRITHSGTHYNVYFRAKKSHHWAGTLSAGRFKTGVQWTMKRFVSVKSVTVFVNGHSDFDHG